MKNTTQVVIIENHELVRRGLVSLIDAEPDLEACAAVPCNEAALRVVRRHRPDVVVIDVSAGRGQGVELIQRIRRLDGGIRVVALAMTDRPELLERSVSAGAAAFVVKTEVAARLLETIRRRGSSRRSQMAAHGLELARAFITSTERRMDHVERGIVEMIGQGVPTRAIAVRLGVSVATVEAYRRKIRTKLNFPTATQLVQFCVRWAERRETWRNQVRARRAVLSTPHFS